MAQGRVANQPGAANMQEMVWDDELSAKAQQWANQCTFEHDPSRYLGNYFLYREFTTYIRLYTGK